MTQISVEPPTDRFGQTLHRPRATQMIITNVVIGVAVLLGWASLGPVAFDSLIRNWRVALTMVFGSLIGGGTSEGGGAIGFPLLTKALGVPATQARLFTYAIQSVGMTGATLSILINRVPVERTALRWGGPPAVLAVVASALALAPRISMRGVRLEFTVILVALALALLVYHLGGSPWRNPGLINPGGRERFLLVLAGLVGGVLSGVAGLGENAVMFVVLVLLFRVSEKIATPTTVILLTLVSLGGFLTHLLIIGDFHGAVTGYWLAAVPVVAFGAPLGALICTRMSPGLIRIVLWTLIAVELLSTLLIIPTTTQERRTYTVVLAATTALCLWFTTIKRYAPHHYWARTSGPEVLPSTTRVNDQESDTR